MTKTTKTSGAPQIKTIRLNADALSLANSGGGPVGGGGTRRRSRRSNALTLFGPKQTRRTAPAGSKGMKRSEMMRKIRHGLLEKKRHASNTSNTSNTFKNRPSSLKANEGATRRNRHDRRAGYGGPTSSQSAAQNAIDFFENKKRERDREAGRLSHDDAGDVGGTLGTLGASMSNHDDALLLPSSPSSPSSPSNQKMDIRVDLPSTFGVDDRANQSASVGILKKKKRGTTGSRETHADAEREKSPALDATIAQRTTRHEDVDSSPADDSRAVGDHSTAKEDHEPHEDHDGGGDTQTHAPSNGSRPKKRRKRSSRLERRKTYRLGKKGRKISVMIYGQNTRKKLRDDHRSANEGDVSKMRRVLRHRCLLKTGSAAPPNLVREIYKNTKLFGDVVAKCNANEANEYLDLGGAHDVPP